jgi:cytochrome c oxidase subunit 2
MRRCLTALLALAALGGCDTVQSMTGGDGRDGALFNQLFTIFMIVALLALAAVLAFLAAAYYRRRDAREGAPPEGDGEAERGEQPYRPLLIGWAALIALGLAGLTLASYFTDRGMARPPPPDRPVLSVEIVANQWWWDVRYHFFDHSKNIRTANELHLPAGVPAMVTLRSNDVIHSFWVPNLAGKQDLIPGRVTDIVLVPNKTGRFRGQCAEVCGVQHAHMALDVIVDTPMDFARWMAAQAVPAPPPATPLAKAGFDYVTNRECASCHNIVGTPASGQVGPDLTHVAARKSIGAGTFPMTRGHLYAWVADPQGAKPGNNMPYIGLEADELHAVVAYLETLK